MIKTVQREVYAQEIQSLENSKTQDQTPPTQMRRSSLYRLQPFLVGRRLRRAEIEYEEKTPAMLLKSSHFTTLTIRHHHEKLHYQGKQITRGRILNAGIWIR